MDALALTLDLSLKVFFSVLQFFLRIEWEGKPLSSQAISLPEKGKKSQESQNVIFSKTEENDTSMNVCNSVPCNTILDV